MGMGEPLANIDAVLAAVDILCHPMGLQLSARKVRFFIRRAAGHRIPPFTPMEQARKCAYHLLLMSFRQRHGQAVATPAEHCACR